MFGLTTELILFILRDRVQLSKPSKWISAPAASFSASFHCSRLAFAAC
jgi:hypothetical protein